MIRKNMRVNIYIAVCVILILLFMQQPASAVPGLRSDLSYTFTNQTKTEFYNSGTTQTYNITEDMPGDVFDIIGSEPQTVYNSDFGTNIILPGGDFDVYPANNRPAQAPSSAYTTGTGSPARSGSSDEANAVSSGGSSSSAPNTSSQSRSVQGEYPGFSHEENTNPVRLTPIEQVRKSDGSIGILSISRIRLNMTVYDGDTFEAMLKGAGHIASTSAWLGNIGIVGHNRGVTNNFGRLKELSAGDIIQYTTTLGTRQYRVTFVGRLAETDWSKLQFTHDNRITLVTCVEDIPAQRLVVQGVEINN
jgi:LPXTG-site transpeptidase (sortase) family protein